MGGVLPLIPRQRSCCGCCGLLDHDRRSSRADLTPPSPLSLARPVALHEVVERVPGQREGGGDAEGCARRHVRPALIVRVASMGQRAFGYAAVAAMRAMPTAAIRIRAATSPASASASRPMRSTGFPACEVIRPASEKSEKRIRFGRAVSIEG